MSGEAVEGDVVAFCRALTGVDTIAERLARSSTQWAARQFGHDAVGALVAAHAAGGLAEVEANEQVGVARALCYYLYTGLGVDQLGQPIANTEPVEEDYFEAVLPRVVQAHPRGLSGGYFGHWHYPPEDADV